MGFLSEKKTLEELEMEKQRQSAMTQIQQERLEQAEKAALIKKAKQRFGPDWRKFFSGGGSGRGSGIDWQALRFRLSK
jgi:hypothetical protein